MFLIAKPLFDSFVEGPLRFRTVFVGAVFVTWRMKFHIWGSCISESFWKVDSSVDQ